MAKTAAGSFSNYSGIDRHKAMQDEFVIPDAVARQDPSIRETVRDNNPWALGLSERGATPSGRSWFDPGRQAERLVRGTGSVNQVKGAQMAQEYANEADPDAAQKRRIFGPRNRGILNQGPIVGGDVVPTPVPPSVAMPPSVPAIPSIPSINVPEMPFSPSIPPIPSINSPSIFSGTIGSPGSQQSRNSIGSALRGGAITGYNPAQARVPLRYY